MSAARGATTAFSGATHHVNDAVQFDKICVLCMLFLALCSSESGCCSYS